MLLLAGGVLAGVGALLGTAHTFDGSPLGSVHSAAWTILLPAVLAILVSQRRPLLGLALCAGAGAAAVGRVPADLSVLTDPNSAVRPELFYELTARAQPFTAAGGVGLLLAGDAVLVLAGVLAARALADRLTGGAAPIFDRTPATGSSTGSATDVGAGNSAGTAAAAADTGQGPELLARAWAAEAASPLPDVDRGTDDPIPGVAGSVRNNGLIVAGFAGVLLLLAGLLGLPYSGGYLAARYLPAELGLAGIGSALAVALVATIAVLVAAVLPRRLAAALLGGVALTAAVPLLSALVVRAAGAPVRLSASVPVGLAGAAVLAAAGLLGTAAPLVENDDVPSVAAVRRTRWVGVALSVLTGVAALAAWRLPQLRYNGGADPVVPGGYAISAPLAAPFLLAAVVPLAAALLWLLPALAAAGRAVSTVGWLPLVFAATQTLYLLGTLVSSASVPNAGFAAPRWTAGAGLWWAVGGTVTGIGAAVVSALAGRQARDSSTLIAEEESLARSRSSGTGVAIALSVLTVVALLLPVYRTPAGSSATLLVGFDVRSWGVLGLGAGMVAVAIAGGRAHRPSGAVAFLLAGAALCIARLIIPASVRTADGFTVAAGWYVGWVTAALFVLAAVLQAVATGRIVMIDAGGPGDAGGPRTGRRPQSGDNRGRVAGRARVADRQGAGRQGPDPAGRRPAGKRTSAGGSSSTSSSTRRS